MSADRIDAIPTQWSLIRRAHVTGMPDSVEEARRALVLRYAPAMRRYLGRLCDDPDAADDLAQEALMKLLRGDYASADPDRGRFRDFLKAAIRNLARSHWAKEAVRRPADFDLGLLGSELDSDDAWLTEWRNGVLDRAWAILKESDREYRALKLRVDFPDETSERLAERYSTSTGEAVRPDAFRQTLRRARERFAEAVIEDVKAGLDDASPERVDEELSNLGLREYLRKANGAT